MIKRFFLLITLCAFFTLKDAYAYLDPGTGSYMLQIIIGTLAAGFFTVKHYWTFLTTKFRGKGKDDTPEE